MLQVLFQNQTTEETKTKVESASTEAEIRAVLATSTPSPWPENRNIQSEKNSEAAAYQHTEVGRSRLNKGMNIYILFFSSTYISRLFCLQFINPSFMALI